MTRGAMRRSTPLRRGAPLRRRVALARKTALKRAAYAPASAAQRAKVAGQRCIACASAGPIDPAHVVPRSLGGCDDALCVVALCRRCHRAYDRGLLDLVGHLEPRWRAQAAHAVGHLGLARALRQISGPPRDGRAMTRPRLSGLRCDAMALAAKRLDVSVGDLVESDGRRYDVVSDKAGGVTLQPAITQTVAEIHQSYGGRPLASGEFDELFGKPPGEG